MLGARDRHLGDRRDRELRAALEDLLLEVGHVDVVVREPDLGGVDPLDVEPGELGAYLAGVHRASGRRQQAEHAGPLDGLAATVDIQLRVDVAQVSANGVRREAELGGDLSRTEVPGQVSHDA